MAFLNVETITAFSNDVQRDTGGDWWTKEALEASYDSAGDFFRLPTDSTDVPTDSLNTEDDSDSAGKGHPYAETVYKISRDTGYNTSFVLNAESIAYFAGLAFGNRTISTPSGATLTREYVSNLEAEIIASEAGTSLPSITMLHGIRPGATPPGVRQKLLGVCANVFNLNFASGPERSASQLVVELVGTGRTEAAPSGAIFPATSILTRQLRSAGIQQITVSPVTGDPQPYGSGRLDTLDFAYNNNLNLNRGFFPGSGVQDEAAVRGRMWRGKPTVELNVKAFLEPGYDERTFASNNIEGGFLMQMIGDLIEPGFPALFELAIPRVRFTNVQLTPIDEYTGVSFTLTPLKGSTNNIATLRTRCARVFPNIG